MNVITGDGPPTYEFTIPGRPVPKPRQTRRDKWAKRACVLRYRAWADLARACAAKAGFTQKPICPLTGQDFAPFRVDWVAYFWDRTGFMVPGSRHCCRPDRDNLDKSLLDALLPLGDEYVSDSLCMLKRWCATKAEERMEVRMWV